VTNPENALISRTMRPHGDDEAMITEVWDTSHPDSPYVIVSRSPTFEVEQLRRDIMAICDDLLAKHGEQSK
jgi:hypothetical protein